MLRDHLALKPDQIAGPLILAAMAIAAQFVGVDALAFDRTAIESAEYWRLVSAHLVHTNEAHLMINLAGVLALWLLQGDDYNARDYLTVTFACAVGLSACLYYLDSSISWYAGLSGILHGLFAWGVTADLRARRHIGAVLVVGLLAKLLLEQNFGAAAASERLIGYPVVVDAHLYGAAIGSLIGALMLNLQRQTPRQSA